MRFPTLSRRLLLPGVVVAVVALLLGAGAAAAFEADTVGSYWGGLWWAISLMTTVGFVGRPPTGTAGQIVSTVLMIGGFLLLSLISAALASLFVREDERPAEQIERDLDTQILTTLTSILERLEALENRPPADPHP